MIGDQILTKELVAGQGFTRAKISTGEVFTSGKVQSGALSIIPGELKEFQRIYGKKIKVIERLSVGYRIAPTSGNITLSGLAATRAQLKSIRGAKESSNFFEKQGVKESLIALGATGALVGGAVLFGATSAGGGAATASAASAAATPAAETGLISAAAIPAGTPAPALFASGAAASSASGAASAGTAAATTGGLAAIKAAGSGIIGGAVKGTVGAAVAAGTAAASEKINSLFAKPSNVGYAPALSNPSNYNFYGAETEAGKEVSNADISPLLVFAAAGLLIILVVKKGK